MSEYLLYYQRVDPTTWVYLSSLLSLGLFFKFNRFWSVRNLDLVLLILLAPGLLLVHNGRREQREVIARATDGPVMQLLQPAAELPEVVDPDVDPVLDPEFAAEAATRIDPETATDAEGDALPTGAPPPPVDDPQLQRERLADELSQARQVELIGFIWLLIVAVLLVIRLLIDPNMVRRPLLEPNLTTGGLIFLCVSSFIFLMANVLASAPARLASEDDLRMRQLLIEGEVGEEVPIQRRPGYALLTLFPQIPTTPLTAPEELGEPSTAEIANDAETSQDDPLVTATRFIAILSHLAIVMGITVVGYRHFDSLKTGVGAATLYLMLPYTAQLTGHIEHSIPAALLVWAVVFYRRPATSGAFLGLAIGCYYYPLFLLPLWISFYWQRGLGRFLAGVLATMAVLVVCLSFKSADLGEFGGHLRTMFGAWLPIMDNLEGVWGLGWDPWYRVPVLALFIGTTCTLAIWPAQKNLGTLISCSGAVMVATQFWHGFGGGLYMGWYLPLLLLTIFRPNLEDRIALSVLGEGWFPRRKRIAA